LRGRLRLIGRVTIKLSFKKVACIVY